MKISSLTARLSLLFGLSSAIVLFWAGLLFAHAGANQFLERDTVELFGKLALIEKALVKDYDKSSLSKLKEQLVDIGLGHPGIVVNVSTNTHGLVFSEGSSEIAHEIKRAQGYGSGQPIMVMVSNRIYRAIGKRVYSNQAAGEVVDVEVALDITNNQQYLENFRQFLWFGMMLAMIAMGGLGWASVRRGLKPLFLLSRQMENISVLELGTEVPVHNAPEELKVVIHSFNIMLRRLNDSFLRLAEFSSDIAHELRTPLHGLMIQTQVTLSGDRSKEDYKAALQANMEEFDRLSRMVNDMLFLAKADNKQLSLKQQSIDMRAEVEHIFEFYESLAAESGVLLQVSGPSVRINADKIMFQRVLSNLVSNALRYTEPGQSVTACIEDLPDEIQLSISNPGEGIPPEALEKLFDRFFRVDQARIQSNAGHAGLGLSIVRAITNMHGWRIEVASGNGCTTFMIRMPTK